MLQEYYGNVTRVVQEVCVHVTSRSEGSLECYKSVTRVLQECYKSVTRVRPCFGTLALFNWPSVIRRLDT
jgi:hypothetical protein